MDFNFIETEYENCENEIVIGKKIVELQNNYTRIKLNEYNIN